ncbi:protein YIF1B-A [Aricia agestis]|uniref:protein YIF1B-A n=1 Tax=Aricia agestis TaxID=91739 RepID=UPI001C20B25E|nr:protein YIF1B-A [Aricia agestis]
MNFNASRNVSAGGGPRKAKRVSDVSVMGSPAPAFPAAPQFNPGYPPMGPPPAYTPNNQFQQGIQLEPGQEFGSADPAANFGYMGGYNQVPMASPAQLGSMLQQPIVQDMALQYGNQLAEQGKAAVQQQLGRLVPVTRLRYYFAVDTRYVLRKIMLILFPFTHKDWMVKYDQDSPVQPRYDINAPDLYIPCMSYVTYVLLAGFMLGLQHRFTPEQISMAASGALAYIIFEMAVYLVTLYVTGAGAALRTLDLLALAGLKYTSMIGALLGALALGPPGYYAALAYLSLALSYFLVKTLRLQLLAGSQTSDKPAYGYDQSYPANPYATGWQAGGGGSSGGGGGTKRRVYFLLFVAVTQPLLSWWLTYHLVPASAPLAPPPAR